MIHNPRVLVFGGGWIGNRLIRENGWFLSGADILDKEAVREAIKDLDPVSVVNAAGKCGSPNIDACLDDMGGVEASNVTGAIQLAKICEEMGRHFIHLSSGCLWESGEGYTPKSPTQPPSFYSRTKVQAEEGMRKTNPAIIRLRMPIDSRPHPRNLIDKLLRYPQLISRPCSVTTIQLLAAAVKEVAQRQMTGTFHVVHPGPITNIQILESYSRNVELVDPKVLVTQEQLLDQGYIKELRSFAILESSADQFDTDFEDAHTAVEALMKEYAKRVKRV